MGAPIKEISLGKCRAAIFQSEFKGQLNYSVKFQKSYQKDNEWKNTDYFSLADLRDLYGLIGYMLDKQVKERTPKVQSKPEPEPDFGPSPADDSSELPF